MPVADAQRWNQRYREGQHAGFDRPRAFLLAQAAWLPTHGLALDVAMGLGANAAWLLSRGLRVIGVDISEVRCVWPAPNTPPCRPSSPT